MIKCVNEEDGNAKYLLQSLMNPEIGFVIQFMNKEDEESGKELALEGFSAYLNPEGVLEGDFKNLSGQEDYLFAHNSGYSDVAESLLNDANIKFKMEFPLNDEGDFIEGYDYSELISIY